MKMLHFTQKVSWGIASPSDHRFIATIPEEASSIEEERVVIFRMTDGPQLSDAQFYTVHKLNSFYSFKKNEN